MPVRFSQPDYVIHSQAPVRICDLGGWTDTWFAEYGQVLSIAVAPVVEVQIAVQRAPERPYIRVHVENYQQEYEYRPGAGWVQHPLIEAAIDSAGLPPTAGLEIAIYSAMPAGASTGTSAAVVVALLGALDRLTPGRLGPYAIAQAAWRVEVEMLGLQSGIQDQLAAAFGGINWIQMDRYPEAKVTPLDLPDGVWLELERRLVLVFLGSAHRSSEVHALVIQQLEDRGPQADQLQQLRIQAAAGHAALAMGDFITFGQVMVANHEAQRNLHPDLINPQAERVVGLARAYGVSGWKTNGAGGPGGSLTLLCGPRADQRRALLREIAQAGSGLQAIPIRLDRKGLQVWETDGYRA
jgi:D-glycero-alpha-D-manno-heptose-7-phosphate kinase